MAAKQETVNEIHEAVAQKCLDILAAPAEKIPAATLKAIMSFVKDNGVTCQEEESTLQTLKDRLKEKGRASVTSLPFVAEG